jgi:hypothetical protein
LISSILHERCEHSFFNSALIVSNGKINQKPITFKNLTLFIQTFHK